MGVRDRAIVYFDGVLKLLGVIHGMFGGLLIVLGIVVRLVVYHWTSEMLLPLWIGVIIAATGVIAVLDSNMENAESSKKYYLIDFLLLSVVSLLLSIMLIICYSMAVHTVFTGEQVGSFSWYSYNRTPDQNVTRTKTLTTFVLFFSCLEFLLCLGSIAYVRYAYRRDFKRKPKSRIEENAPYFSANDTNDATLF
ncbi:uncharacterized protein LOC111341837 [Stylophora pistillata]|uniref:Uncharacterized protein n=1 Tax=Stylophora pistillata TaxID=50429 RepID=A0A2B4RJQ4_STYPI|nr:uncharacterized protein LOC111341837 [Stylophora pistillata]PFX16720.1 hypothetical protein AWC38_SpisGene18984 [Stylophora pistillata]